jgi:tetratricopeptide (TPR) repeat protein
MTREASLCMTRVICASIFLIGCAHQKVQRVEMDPLVFVAKPEGGVAMIDPEALFADAGAAYAEKKYTEAVAIWDRMVAEFGESRWVNACLYNAGLALEAAGDLDGAAARYRKLTARPCKAGCNDQIDGLYRLGNVYAEQKNWTAAAELWKQTLSRSDITVSDRVEAMARRAEAQFSLRDLGAAERTIREQQELVKANSEQERLDTDFFVGMGAYYLGRVAHEQYRLLPVRGPDKQLAEDLEAKARLLLMAQARYLDAMRVNNVEWATAAGYQIGSLYHELYDDLINAPVAATGEAREVYLEQLRERIKTLLQKAVSIHEKNLLMAERNGVDNQWVQRSNEEMANLKRLLLSGPRPLPAQPSQPPPPAPPLPKPPLPRDEVPPRVVM